MENIALVGGGKEKKKCSPFVKGLNHVNALNLSFSCFCANRWCSI